MFHVQIFTMLIISKKQLYNLNLESEVIFRKNLQKYFINNFAGLVKGKSGVEIDQLIKDGINKAHVYGITSKNDLIIFLEFVFYYGLDFEGDPKNSWATKILNRKDISGPAKIRRIDKRFAFEIRHAK